MMLRVIAGVLLAFAVALILRFRSNETLSSAAMRNVMHVERRLLAQLRGRMPGMLGVGATILAANVVAVAQPWPLKILIDDVLGKQRLWHLNAHGALAVSIGLTLGLLIATGLLSVVSSRVQWGLAQGLTQDLRRKLFMHLTKVSLRFHEKRTAGDTIYRVTTDTYAVQNLLVQGLVPLVSAALRIVLTFAVMFRMNAELAVLATASAPLAAAISYRFRTRIRDRSVDYAQRESAVYAQTEQTMSGIRTVQAFSREAHELDRFDAAAGDSRRAFVELVTIQTVFKLAIDLTLGLGMGAVTWLAATQALSGHLSPGQVLVFLTYAGGLYLPLTSLAAVYSSLQSAAVGAQRVFEVLDEPTVPDNGTTPPPRRRALGAIEVRDVSFAYDSAREVLHEISFDANPGELVALVGPTGAGKSTIASLLLRLYDVVSGAVILDGIDVRELPLGWMREQVALVPQDPILFPLSIRENIRYGRLDATDAEVDDAARAANLYDELMDHPLGLDMPLGDRGVTLSGGQRQRVAIARAFLKDAPVIILDEPTSALDASTESAVMDAVAKLAAGRTSIVIAHRLSTVERADQVLVVSGGRIVQRGTHKELVGRRGMYADLHRARFGAQPRLRVIHAAAEPAPKRARARGGKA